MDDLFYGLTSGAVNLGQLNAVIEDLEGVEAKVDTLETSKQDKLIAGDNIIIDETTNVISSSGGGADVSIWRYE